jgi:hypothetical protein
MAKQKAAKIQHGTWIWFRFAILDFHWIKKMKILEWFLDMSSLYKPSFLSRMTCSEKFHRGFSNYRVFLTIDKEPLEFNFRILDRRKFRSQISDNMNRWKAEQGKGRKKRIIRRKKLREKKESEERRYRCAKR